MEFVKQREMYFLCFIVILSAVPRSDSSDKQQSSSCWNRNKSCPIGFKLNQQNCTCVLDNNRSYGLLSQLRRANSEMAQSTNHNCSDSRMMWNGRKCVSSAVLCPGGYQWNGSTCISQSTMQIRVSVSTNCSKNATTTNINSNTTVNKKEPMPMPVLFASTAIRAESLPRPDSFTDDDMMPITTSAASAEVLTEEELQLPIYKTSPLCPFGHIWENNECQRAPPTCTDNFVYANGKCMRRSTQFNRPNKWQKRSVEPDNVIVNESKKCCTVISPRYCRPITPGVTDKWLCFHQKTKGCGNICVKPVVFLQPQRQMWTGSLLVMPAPSRRLSGIFNSNNNRIQRSKKTGKYLHCADVTEQIIFTLALSSCESVFDSVE